ncbi:MAG: hypothetical protein ACR2RV_07125 [Verrucomicrobiales bacterium]
MSNQIFEGFRDRIAIERKAGIRFLALGEFFVEALAQFRQRSGDLVVDQPPLGDFAVTGEIAADIAGAPPDPRHILLKFWIIQHLFDIPESIRPLAEIFSEER